MRCDENENDCGTLHNWDVCICLGCGIACYTLRLPLLRPATCSMSGLPARHEMERGPGLSARNEIPYEMLDGLGSIRSDSIAQSIPQKRKCACIKAECKPGDAQNAGRPGLTRCHTRARHASPGMVVSGHSASPCRKALSMNETLT